MPRATIASRQLKNKDTGLDLFVPNFKEVKGLMSSTVYYQVVLVSNLACFKTPSHKPSDVVQYSIEKQWSEFEELRTKVSEVYPGTVLPVLNKKSIIVNDLILRERRNNLDHFLKFLTSVSKLATCAPLLQFLGVDPGRAKRFGQGELLEGPPKPDDENQEGNIETNESEVYVFEDNFNEQPDTDLFNETDKAFEDEDLFGAEGNRAQVSMFEEQDMKRELTEEDEKDFGFIPDAIITKKETIRISFDETEDNSDLFVIEDDLDRLMTIDVGKKQPQQKETSSSSEVKSKTPSKPAPAPKPKPAGSTSISDRTKPSSANESDDTSRQSSSKPAPAFKPKPAPKPRSANSQVGSRPKTDSGKKSTSEVVAFPENAKDSASVDKLDQDDILKYLQENSAASTDEVDLFS